MLRQRVVTLPMPRLWFDAKHEARWQIAQIRLRVPMHARAGLRSQPAKMRWLRSGSTLTHPPSNCPHGFCLQTSLRSGYIVSRQTHHALDRPCCRPPAALCGFFLEDPYDKCRPSDLAARPGRMREFYAACFRSRSQRGETVSAGSRIGRSAARPYRGAAQKPENGWAAWRLIESPGC
jgi:hypothetical protein